MTSTERTFQLTNFEGEERKSRIMVEEKVDGKVITRPMWRRFYDIHVTTYNRQTGKTLTETFVTHVYRKAVRVIVKTRWRHARRESMPLHEFAGYCGRRWGVEDGGRVYADVVSFYTKMGVL